MTWGAIMKLNFYIFIALFIFVSCNNLSKNVNDSNNPPVISEIIVDTQPVRTSTQVFLTVIATDKDGDNLTYYWQCSSGKILTGGASDIDPYSPTTNPTKWETPSQTGKYTITCTVSDGKDIVTKSLEINVI